MREKRLSASFDAIEPLKEDAVMKRGNAKTHGLALGLSLLGMALAPALAAAQSQLDVSEAQAFMGSWIVTMDSDFGTFQMDLDITDEGGKVAASMGSPEMGGSQPIEDITRSEESLVLRFEANAQGQFFEVSVALTPNGENLDVYFEVGTGEFSAYGVATRATS